MTTQINFSKPCRTAVIRTLMVTLNVPRCVAGLNGGLPVFPAQVILRELGFKGLSANREAVSMVDIEVAYGNDEFDGVCESYYGIANMSATVAESRDYRITVCFLNGINIVNLIFKETGMAVPFYVYDGSVKS